MHVAIFGQMGNGKSTFAELLLKALNDTIVINPVPLYPFQRAAFAAGVKQAVCDKYGVTHADIEHWKNDNRPYPGWNVTMRQALQMEGQVGRDVCTTTWIDRTLKYNFPIVIDDGRYINEAEAVRNRSGYNILIVRPGHYNGSTHPSEWEIGLIASRFHETHDTRMIPADISTEIEIQRQLNLFQNIVINQGNLDTLKTTAETLAIDILNHFENNSTHKPE